MKLSTYQIYPHCLSLFIEVIIIADTTSLQKYTKCKQKRIALVLCIFYYDRIVSVLEIFCLHHNDLVLQVLPYYHIVGELLECLGAQEVRWILVAQLWTHVVIKFRIG